MKSTVEELEEKRKQYAPGSKEYKTLTQAIWRNKHTERYNEYHRAYYAANFSSERCSIRKGDTKEIIRLIELRKNYDTHSYEYRKITTRISELRGQLNEGKKD